MKAGKLCRILLAITACLAIVGIAACARPGIDGGIVGTGNRIDCSNKDGAQGSVPKECEPGAR